LTSKGQITIPSSVRKKLHLHAGDKIDFSLVGEHEVLKWSPIFGQEAKV